jgi:nitroreductase
MPQSMTQQLNSNLTPWSVSENDFPRNGTSKDQMQFLLRYAVLAQSFYNTQPWEFSVENNQINVYAKPSRWLKSADQEKRELYLSIGCALENLLIAAEHFRFGHQISRFPEPENNNWVARVIITTISQSSALRSPALFNAITKRHTHHGAFDPLPIKMEHVQTIQKFLTEEDVWFTASADPQIKEKITQYAAHANTILFSDDQFSKEINKWASAGVFGRPWLQQDFDESGEQIVKDPDTPDTDKPVIETGENLKNQQEVEQVTVKQLNQREREIITSASTVAVLSSPFDNHMMHVITGQIFEKLCLEAALIGIRCLPLNQLIEIPELRGSIRDLFPAMKGKPLVVFVMGYGKEETLKEWSPRLSFEEVLLH